MSAFQFRATGGSFSPDRGFDLSAVRVSAQRQIDLGANGLAKYQRIMGEQQLHLVRKRSVQSCLYVCLSGHVIIDAGQPKRRITHLKSKALIDQNRHALAAQKMCYESRVGPMIVIPKTRIGAEFRFEPAQNLSHRRI